MDSQQNTPSSDQQSKPTPPPAPSAAPTSTPNTSTDMKQNTLMAVLAYIGPLVIVPYLTAKEDPFVKFHIKQGFVLVVIEIILWVVGAMFFLLWVILPFLHLCLLVLSIIGIVHAVKGEQKELPLVGKYGVSFKI